MNEYPLHWYVFENDLDALKQLISKISKVNYKQSTAYRKKQKYLEYFIYKQNDIDKKDLRNKTALELAIFLDHYECAKLLLENGADCSLITKTGWNRI